MKAYIRAACLMLAVSLAACNLPSNEPPEVEATQTSFFPSNTPLPLPTSLPTETPLPTLTATPTIPIAWPLDKGVNCRLGPGLEWIVTGYLLVGDTAAIQGRNGDSSWWYVVTKDAPGTPCWVAASVTVTAGNLANLPLINPPTASVTKVDLKLDPKESSLPGCIGPAKPIEVTGTIETNGPAKVNYYFESQQGGALPPQSINFNGADSKNVQVTINPTASAGSFWVKLIVTGPNDKVGEKSYKIECP
ncbi:MAG: hypothetical protein FJZ87_00090 [Chloroflexi bacterium]|nr:hypothetical protein [Chloroflexota bacterium]